MPPTLAAVPKGHQFPATEFALTLEWVQEYTEAVEDMAIGALGANHVPPMALAALAIRSLLQRAALPPGTVHAAQELSFRRRVDIGETLRAAATVVSRGERQGWVLMSIDLVVSDASGSPVMTGRATVSFPAGDAA
jgi:acyl dehydratase